jgi:hypothetical protein
VNAADETVYQVGYRIQGSVADAPWTYIAASSKLLTDRNIFNDNTVRWYTATLVGLSPDTRYEYAIVAVGEKPEAPLATFRTAPDEKAPLTFLWMSDTHNNPGKHSASEKSVGTASGNSVPYHFRRLGRHGTAAGRLGLPVSAITRSFCNRFR